VSYALSQLYEGKENSPPKEVNELVDVKTFEAACNPPNLCVISFLPDLQDTGASGRNAYLQIVKSVAEKQKRQPITFLWASAMAQPALEKDLGVGGFGYPALVVMNAKKQRLGQMVFAFTEEDINKYLERLLGGRETTVPLPAGLAGKVKQTTPWDGKDHAVEQLSEVDLSELGIDIPKVEAVHEEL